jgi:hypothetical protein
MATPRSTPVESIATEPDMSRREVAAFSADSATILPMPAFPYACPMLLKAFKPELAATATLPLDEEKSRSDVPCTAVAVPTKKLVTPPFNAKATEFDTISPAPSAISSLVKLMSPDASTWAESPRATTWPALMVVCW